MPKLSIYLPDSTFQKLGEPENISARIAHMIDAYTDIARQAKPDLSRAEWAAICESADPLAVKFRPNEMRRYLWAMIDESKVELPKRFKYDRSALALKLRHMAPASVAFIIEIILRYSTLPLSTDIERRLEQALEWTQA